MLDPQLEGNIAPSGATPDYPDYAGLVRFLILPFLEMPDHLKVDCEVSAVRSKALIRLAFDSSDKGRVFGRGGRNIQAIRTVLEGIAKTAGHSINLDVFGSNREDPTDAGSINDAGPQPRQSAPKKAAPKLRPKPSA